MNPKSAVRGVVRVLNVPELVDYNKSWRAQKNIAAKLAANGRNSSNVEHTLILLQHKPGR